MLGEINGRRYRYTKALSVKALAKSDDHRLIAEVSWESMKLVVRQKA